MNIISVYRYVLGILQLGIKKKTSESIQRFLLTKSYSKLSFDHHFSYHSLFSGF